MERPAEIPYDQPQTWFFTFGFGQEHPNGYVVFEGMTGADARDEMNRLFDRKWGFQYDAHDWFKDGISQAEKYGLHQVPNPDAFALTFSGDWPRCFYDEKLLCGDRETVAAGPSAADAAAESLRRGWHVGDLCECPSCPIRVALAGIVHQARGR